MSLLLGARRIALSLLDHAIQVPALVIGSRGESPDALPVLTAGPGLPTDRRGASSVHLRTDTTGAGVLCVSDGEAWGAPIEVVETAAAEATAAAEQAATDAAAAATDAAAAASSAAAALAAANAAQGTANAAASAITALQAATTAAAVARLLSSGQVGQICHGTSSTVLTGYGSLIGSTVTTDAARSSGVGVAGRFYSQDTSALAGNNAGWASPDAFTRMDVPGVYTFNVSWTTLTSIRFFVGLASSTTIGNVCDSDTISGNAVGFQFSTDRGDTTLKFVVANGSSQSVSDTAVAIVGGTVYSLEIEVVSATSIAWRIYSAAGTLLGSGTVVPPAAIPASTQTFFAVHAGETRTTAARTFVTHNVSARTFGCKR